jgi:hypothetical protein
MKKRVVSVLIITGVLAALLLSGCQKEEQRSVTALELMGSAMIMAPDENEWKELMADDVIVEGSALRTGDDGYVHLAVSDGTDINLAPGTQVRLSELSPDMQNPQTTFELLDGISLWPLQKRWEAVTL